MKTIRHFLTVALILHGVQVTAQHHYAEGYLRPGKESVFAPEQTDNIGQVLVSAYLNGKIKAYSFMSRDSILKFVVVSRNMPKWKAGERYYLDDMVEYNGSDYYLVIDDDRSKSTPDKNPDKWVLTSPIIDVISKLRLLPTEKDTLSKADFLQQLVIREGTSYPSWSESYEYYTDDIVNYNGINYYSNQDNKNIVPGSNTEIWQRTSQGDPDIRNLRDINSVGILYNYTPSDADTVWNPQFVIAKLNNDYLGLPLPVAYFKYHDVVRYLNTIQQPMSGSSELAHSGDFTFCITYSNSQKILWWLKERVKLNSKIVTKGISDPALYHAWLEDTVKARPQYELAYTVMQNVANGELLLSKVVSGYEHLPFLRVTLKDLKKLSGGEIKAFVPSANFGTAISDRSNFYIPLSEHKLDSLAPMNLDRVNATSRNGLFFVERYSAKISNQKIIDLRLIDLWHATCKQYAEQKLKERHFPATYYPDEYDWTKIGRVVLGGYTFTFDKNTSFNPVGDVIGYKESVICDRLDELEIHYEREYSSLTGKKNKFRPLFVTFVYDVNLDSKWPVSLTFDWTELKAALGTDYNPFFEAVENGQLSFYRSEVVYGLRER